MRNIVLSYIFYFWMTT